MLKIVPNPEFKADVEITVPGQKDTGEIPLTFKYRTNKEFSAWFDTFKNKDGGIEIDEDGLVKIFQEFVVGWGLKEDFTEENLVIFFDNYSKACVEILGEYSRLLFESRLKN